MDNTTLTIIGMIAAFLTASITPILTEAIKDYLQHKTKLWNLRVALYKEMWNNYNNLSQFSLDGDVDSKTTTVEYSVRAALVIRAEEIKWVYRITMFSSTLSCVST